MQTINVAIEDRTKGASKPVIVMSLAKCSKCGTLVFIDADLFRRNMLLCPNCHAAEVEIVTMETEDYWVSGHGYSDFGKAQNGGLNFSLSGTA
jgi:hypothetical protein